MTSSAVTSASDDAGSLPGSATAFERPTTAGSGAFTIARAAAASVVTRVRAASPLRLLLPRNHGHAAWVYTSSYGGGLVDRDATALDVTVEPGAEGFVSTQASTKVYRSPNGVTAALRVTVGAGAMLTVAPDPVVCFAGARYRQLQHVHLAGDAGLVLVDWLTSGRRARGERWAFDEYASRTLVWLDGRLLVHEALALRAADGPLAPRVGRFDVYAFLAVLGTPCAGAAGEIADRIGARPGRRGAAEIASVRRLGVHGCAVRIAGASVEEVGRTLRDLLGFVPARLGDDPWARKW